MDSQGGPRINIIVNRSIHLKTRFVLSYKINPPGNTFTLHMGLLNGIVWTAIPRWIILIGYNIMPVRYNLSSVWVRLSIFSQLSVIHYTICGAVFSLPISFVMIEIIYILCLIIIIESEVWTNTHCLGLGHETMVCAVCLSIFLLHCDNLDNSIGVYHHNPKTLYLCISSGLYYGKSEQIFHRLLINCLYRILLCFVVL